MPDPFGLKAGSTPESGMANYMVSFHAVPKPHPAFTRYSGLWTPESGLSRVMAYSASVEDENDCRSSRRLYDQVKRQLVQVYGGGQELEYVDPDSAWPEDDEFWTGLSHDVRQHSTLWQRASGAKLDAGLETIQLMILADDDYEKSHVVLSYEFEGFKHPERADEFGMDSL